MRVLSREESDMSRSTITQKQQEILEYIKESILSRGYPPAVREICEAVHLRSTSSVHAHLETLEKKGYIRKDPAKPRTIDPFRVPERLTSIVRRTSQYGLGIT